MIRLDAVHYSSEGFVADFDFETAKAEFVAVIGPSGSGKSTLLSLIAGFEAPRSGRILLDGKDMTQASPSERPVTMVFQDHNSFAHLDLWTNVALGISPSLRLTAAERQSVDDALARTGLGALAQRKPGEVSGGERQRVAIARALLRDEPILLLDEPFAALGPALRREMLDLVKELQKEKDYTVVLVSHHPDDALYAATRTAFLSNGRILAFEPTRQLFKRNDLPELESYIG
ncbi:thiamine ABC transporter ATP-binding protein [Taklimakanibacter deserti]|uniref:thiamine ABC transporter ATP-binding protein n=1 Tax=Taklimakanibacter deserti TaxID=2267839 RepID=UPI0034D69345